MERTKPAALLLSVVMLAVLLCACRTAPVPARQDSGAPSPQQQDAQPQDGANEPEWFGSDDGKTVTLNFWCGIQPEYGYQQMIDNFNREYAGRGVQVAFNKYSNDTDGNTQLETYLLTGSYVDVFIGYGSRDRLFARGDAGMLYDYSGYLDSVGFDVARELGENTAQKYVSGDGAVWGLPTKFDNKGWIMINADAFESAGVDIPYNGWTYDEFLDACRRLGENTDMYAICWGFGFDYASKLNYVSSVLAPNGYFTDETMTETNLNHPVWIKGLQLIRDTMDEGWALPLEQDLEGKKDTVKTEFLTGKCAMFGIYSQLRLAMDTAAYPHDFVTALVPFPVPSEEYAMWKTQAGQSYSGDFISIASKCENKKAACEFVRWYIQGGMNPIILAARYPLWNGSDTQEILDVVSTCAAGTVDPKSLSHLFSVDRSAFTDTGYVSGHDEDIKAIVWEEWMDYLSGKTPNAEGAMWNAKQRADEVIKESGGLLAG
ncbi:MAG: extracellular solute-binding protein [Oscillospiraceae bacterium]|nr:extracellular solute-binding protein [Oscillospiraceae bacterium]